MKYLSLFSGIGGFELGIQKAHESDNEHACIGPQSKSEECRQGGFRSTDKHGVLLHAGDEATPLCIGYSEIDKYAIEIYQKRFPEHKNYGDITKLDTATLPDFDLLVGGFPCQAFSIAGKRSGFNDTRGTLFFEIARILGAKRPRLFLLENVKGLLSHDNGRTFEIILSTLDELGYDLQWQVLNSKNHGVPQNRERIFIVGHLRGTPRPEVFPIGEGDKESDTARKEAREEVANTLRAKQGGPDLENSYCVLQRGRGKNAGGEHELAPTMTGRSYQDNNVLNLVGSIRKLTPTECERLQGFPDGWTEGVSDTQRYKCLGNAVTVNVIRDIYTKMKCL